MAKELIKLICLLQMTKFVFSSYILRQLIASSRGSMLLPLRPPYTWS